MIAKLTKPPVVAAFALVLSLGLGVSLGWRALSRATAHLHLRAPEVPPAMKAKGWGFWTIEVDNLASELRDQRKQLQHEADVLDQRAAQLAAEEGEFAQRRAELDAVEKKISDQVIAIKADEAGNLRSLAATYSNMSAKAVVAILRQLDDRTAVKILSLMKPDVVGPIFEEMATANPTNTDMVRRAAMLSEKLRLMKSASSKG